jgi:pyrroline-5-carboxylate reductase
MRNIGIIGAGKMGSIILNALHTANKHKLSYYSPSPKTLSPSFVPYKSVKDTVKNNDTLFICTLPHKAREVISPHKTDLKGKMLISIAAGLSLKELKDMSGNDCKVVRTMPNTPCKVLKGVTAYSVDDSISKEENVYVRELLTTMGEAIEVEEKLIDPISGLSGSGPAYACMIIEAFADGGVRAGIPRNLAYKLACHTLLGTSSMILETKQHPGILKDEVSSPAGATIEGIFHLEQSGLRYSVMQAVLASCLKCSSFSEGNQQKK